VSQYKYASQAYGRGAYPASGANTRVAVCAGAAAAAAAAAGVCLAYAACHVTPAQLLEDVVATKYRSLRSLRHTLRATFEELLAGEGGATTTVSRGAVAKAVGERPFVVSQLRALGLGNLVTLEVLERDSAGRVDLWELLAHFELEAQLLEIYERCDEGDTGVVPLHVVRESLLGACRREPQLLVILSSIMDEESAPGNDFEWMGGRYGAAVGRFLRACSPWAHAKVAANNRQCVKFFFELVGADGDEEVSMEEILEVFRATLSVKREMDEEDGKESVVGPLKARLMDSLPLSIRAPASVDLRKSLRREDGLDGSYSTDLILKGLSKDSVRSAVARLRHTGGQAGQRIVNSKACQDVVQAFSDLKARATPEMKKAQARFKTALKSPAFNKLRWA